MRESIYLEYGESKELTQEEREERDKLIKMIDDMKELGDAQKMTEALPEDRFGVEEIEEPDNIIDFESLRKESKESIKKTSFDNASVDYNYFDDYIYEF